MAKEEILETQEKIEKALAKEQEIKDRAELLVDKVEMLKDTAKEIKEQVIQLYYFFYVKIILNKN